MPADSSESWKRSLVARSIDASNLAQSDKELVSKVSHNIPYHMRVGSLVGLATGVLLGFRVRRSKTRLIKTFRMTERPLYVRFASGREGACALEISISMILLLKTQRRCSHDSIVCCTKAPLFHRCIRSSLIIGSM